MDGADRWRRGIKSWKAMGVSSRSVIGIGGELCGLFIIGMGDAGVRAGRGVEDNGCGCGTSLRGLAIGDAPAPPDCISSLSAVFAMFLTRCFLSRAIRWSDVDAMRLSVAGWSDTQPRVVLT